MTVKKGVFTHFSGKLIIIYPMKTAIVILAGGNGTRLWPVSRDKKPKQFHSIIDSKSLIRNVFERYLTQYKVDDIFISTNLQLLDLVRQELPEVLLTNYIIEPVKRDRTAAFGLISLNLQEKGYETVLIGACDEYIGNPEEYLRVLKLAEEINAEHPNQLLQVGMNPTFASIAYGYIEMGEPVARFGKDIVFSVASFKEKPDLKTAEKFINDWRYLWNSGWFIFNPDFMVNTYEKLAPETLEILRNCYKMPVESKEFETEYSKCAAEAFDIAIVEKMENKLVLPASVGWSDIGSWKGVKDILSGLNPDSNVFQGDVSAIDSCGNLVVSKTKRKIALIGLKNIAIIDTEDCLFVSDLNLSENLKSVLKDIDDKYK